MPTEGIIASLLADPALLFVSGSIGLIAVLLREQTKKVVEFGAVSSFIAAGSSTGLLQPALNGDITSFIYLVAYLAIQPFKLHSVGNFSFPVPAGISVLDMFFAVPIIVLVWLFRNNIKAKWASLFNGDKEEMGTFSRQRAKYSAKVNLLYLLTFPLAFLAYKYLAFGVMLALEPTVPVQTQHVLQTAEQYHPMFLVSGSLIGVSIGTRLKSMVS